MSGPDLMVHIQQRARIFVQKGLTKNHSVVLRHGNSIYFFIDLFAIWILEACAIPIDGATPEIEIQGLAKRSRANFEIQCDHGDLIRLNSTEKYNLGHLILYTSGSAGQPKGVVHSISSIENKIFKLKKHLCIENFKRTLCVLPTFFGHGLIGNCLFPLLNGCHLFIGQQYNTLSTEKIVQIIDQHQITFVSSVPSFWNFFKKHPGPLKNSLQRIHCASEAFPEQIFNQIQDWAPSAQIFNVYGLTELASWVSGQHINHLTKKNSVGHGWDVEFQIRNPDQSGVGEVWIKSSTSMVQYFDQIELTDERNQSGWFDTKDLGTWDTRDGLILAGRSDGMINKGGQKIYPNEVESVLLKKVEISAACVFSIPHHLTGQTVAAAYTSDDQNVSNSILEEFCRTLMPAYRCPTQWFRFKDFPINSRGKINRIELKKMCLILQSQIKDQIVGSGELFEFEKIVRTVFNLENTTDLKNIKYGSPSNWDSIRHIEIFIKLQKKFKIEFTAEEIIETHDMQGLTELYLKKTIKK